MKKVWFKHFSDASSGASLRTLFDNKDYEAYALYWILLEMMARFEDKDRLGSMTISWHVIARETGWKPTKCARVLSRICSVSKIDMEEKPDGNVTFLIPKWSELQTSWGGKRRARSKQDPGRSKKLEVRSKNIDQTPMSASPPELDFSALYQQYPRKIGKSKGLKLAKAQIKTQAHYDELALAIKHYAQHVVGSDPKFIKHFSTFMGEWRDWIDPQTGSTTARPKLVI